MANKNRTKGHNFERYLVNVFKDLGFTYCKTSRFASRVLDNSKVDLAFIPYNVQAKAVIANINYHDLLLSMENSLNENFPPTDPQRNYPKIIFHKKGRKKYEKLVIMQQDEFISILKELENAKRSVNGTGSGDCGDKSFRK